MAFYFFQTLVNKIERMGISNIMGAPSALSISTGMYNRPALTSPMAQLTCLLPSQTKQTIPEQKTPTQSTSKFTIFHAFVCHLKKKLNVFSTAKSPPSTSLGVPGKPGSDALNKRLEQLNSRKQRRQGGGVTRPDLGTVVATSSTKKVETQQQETTALGTLSSLFFGRKGGWF